MSRPIDQEPIRIPFEDKIGRGHIISYYQFQPNFGDAPATPNNMRLLDDIFNIVAVSLPIFAENNEGHDILTNYLSETSQIAIISSVDDPNKIEGYYLFRQIEVPYDQESKSVLYIGSVAISPEMRNTGLIQASQEILARRLKPDIIAATTINPALYKAYERVAQNLGYSLYPRQDEPTNLPIVDLARRILMALFNQDPTLLDDDFVRRGYTSSHHQETIPYLGFNFFENTLRLSPQDGVLCILIKN